MVNLKGCFHRGLHEGLEAKEGLSNEVKPGKSALSSVTGMAETECGKLQHPHRNSTQIT